jgi:hypothetical protein
MVPDGADDQPSGGVKVLFEHAALSMAAGVAAELIVFNAKQGGVTCSN